MKKVNFVFLICIGFWFSSCSKKIQPTAKQDTDNMKGYVKAMVKQFKGREGCDIALKLESGELLEPKMLPESFQKDSLPVWVKYKLQPNVASICMMGKMVIVKDIKKR